MIIFKTRTNLAHNVAFATVDTLTDLLSTYLDMASLFKHAHWNVKGEEFVILHQLFDEQERVFRDLADIIAERITALGGIAHGTAQSIVDFSILDLEPDSIYNCMEYVQFLADRLSIVDGLLMEEIEHLAELGDSTTSNLLQDHLHIVDKHLYHLEAHLPIFLD